MNSKQPPNKTKAHLELYKLDKFMYLGGTGTYYHYSFMRGFSGAMSELIVNNRQLDLDTDARLMKKLNVAYSSTCSNALCNNRGVCVRAQNRVGYKCLCAIQSSDKIGSNCELHDAEHEDNSTTNECDNQCKNGATCSQNGSCDCPIGFTGFDCSFSSY